MEIKPLSFFVLSLPSHLVCFFISILHYNLVFDCKFIWKSYVNFPFIELIFVIVKDTYLLIYYHYHIIYQLFTYHPKIIGHILKNKPKKKLFARPKKTKNKKKRPLRVTYLYSLTTACFFNNFMYL